MRVATRAEVEEIDVWARAFAGERKDRRYYEIVEDTLAGFEYGYFVLEDAAGAVEAVQPFFSADVDPLMTASAPIRHAIASLRRLFPDAFRMRALMVGCAAGEGHLAGASREQATRLATCLHEALLPYARQTGVQLVVLKEFPVGYREALSCFSENGYTRIPSLPMTRLNIAYSSFDEFMRSALSRATRKNLRRKFRKGASGAPITMELVTDVDAVVDEIYPLYLNVYARSRLRFEKLTREYLCRLAREMPDRARFFVWRQSSRPVAFSLCMTDGDTIYDEYLGLDYSVALDLHLYFWTLRDVVQWAIEHGYSWYVSTALNYDPKRRLGCELVPLDLYVAHTARLGNWILRRALPLLDPTKRDATLRSFPDYPELRTPVEPVSAGQIRSSDATFRASASSRVAGSSLGWSQAPASRWSERA